MITFMLARRVGVALGAATLAPLTVLFVPSLLASQRDVSVATRARRDSTPRPTSRARHDLGRCAASGAAPISQKTLTSSDLAPRYFGQDVPLLLQGAAPSLTSYAETGNYWGYSYIRLRGIDQSRINLTIDGIPLNDPEDQVLYFADFPDLANSLALGAGAARRRHEQQRHGGVRRLDQHGDASALRRRNASADFQIEGGSFGSRRGSAEYRSGLTSDRLAIYARVSDLQHGRVSLSLGRRGKIGCSLSAGYFGDRDIVKLTATTGTMKDTMAYLAVPVTDLDTNRRINPLTPQERDGFGERHRRAVVHALVRSVVVALDDRLPHLGERRLRRADRLRSRVQPRLRLVRRDERLERAAQAA